MIKETVRRLRKDQTPEEAKFWQLVRNKNIDGKKFVRQYPIEFEIDDKKRFFVADFYCHQHKLVVELDGGIHKNQKDYDSLRTYIIERLGYTVIRFSNDEVKYETDFVIERLKKQLTP